MAKKISPDVKIEIKGLTEENNFISPIGLEITARTPVEKVQSISKESEGLYSNWKNYLFPEVFWKLGLYLIANDPSSNYLSVMVLCRYPLPYFGCFIKYKCVLLSEKKGVNDIIKEGSDFYSSEKKHVNIPDLVLRDDLLNIENGFIKNKEMVLMIEIWAEPPYGGCWDSRHFTGYAGLENSGNMDSLAPHVSSVLQILYFTNELRNAVYGTVTSTRNGESNVTSALQRIFFELQFNEDVVDLDEFEDEIIEINDSSVALGYEEYLQFLTNSLRENMKYSAYKDTVSNLFDGKLKTIVKCDNIDCESEIVEAFSQINLSVVGNQNIYDALNEFIKVEKMEGECKYDAGVHGFQDATKYIHFELLPPVLHVHLARFQYDTTEGCTKKINSRFEFYEEIDLAKLENFENNMDAKYTLQAVLVDSNEKFRNSHFAFISPNVDGLWYKFDSEVVCQVIKSEAIEGNFGYESDGIGRSAIMLVYIKKSETKNILPTNEEGIYNISSSLPMLLSSKCPVDFTNFLDNEYLSDVSVLVDNNKRYKCHRVFLSNFSFKNRNIDFNEKEGCESTIDLREHQFDTDAFESVLRYNYGGKCGVTSQNVCSVFEISSFLQITVIQRNCISFAKKLNLVDQIYKMFKIAKLFGDTEMCERLSTVILSNFNYLVDPTVKYLNLDEMHSLIAKGIEINKDKKSLLASALKWTVENRNGADDLTELVKKIDLNAISIRDIKEVCRAEYVVEFERIHNPDILFIPPLHKRLWLNDENVIEQGDVENKSVSDDSDDDELPTITDNIMSISNVTADYSHLIVNGICSDIVVQIDSKFFECHRVLLARNSPVFYAMFNNPTYTENVKKKVELNLDSEAFAEIINLIYTGSFTITSTNIINLLVVSEYLEMNIAREKCIEYSRHNLNFSNVVDVYVFAHHQNINSLLEITKTIILTNLRYLTAMGFLANIHLSGLKSLLEISNDSVAPEANHLLTAVLKWVTADESERIKSSSELLSMINLSSVSRSDLIQILNENTNFSFRSSHPYAVVPIFERFLESDNPAESISDKEYSLHLVIKVGKKYHICQWNHELNFQHLQESVESLNKGNAIYEDSNKLRLEIAALDGKIHVLNWNTLEFAKLVNEFEDNTGVISPLHVQDRKPSFHIPGEQANRQEYFYLIPGMKYLTVFSQIENAFHIFDENNSTWEVRTLGEQSFVPNSGRLLLTCEKNLVVLAGDSYSDFKLVDIRTNAIISIPKPQVLKKYATITLFNHRLYMFSVHNDVRKSVMFDLFTNKWIALPDLPPVSGDSHAYLMSVGAKNYIKVFETREFDDEKDGVSYKCFVHHLNLDTQKWSSSVTIPGIIQYAISAFTN